MLKHAAQLFEYVTGISCRIGYPNEHLSELPENEITSPSFSTGVGLVLKGYEDSIEHTNDEEPIRDELEVSPTETIGANFFNAVKRFFEADDEVQN